MRRLALAAAAIIVVTATPALADRPGRGWISAERASGILAKRGYKVTKIEADDGHWEGEARRGRVQYEFHVDPRTGAVTKLERDR